MTETDPRIELFAAAENASAAQLAHRFDRTALVIETDVAHAVLALSIANLAARLWPNTRVIGPSGHVSAGPLGEGRLNRVSRSLVAAVRLTRDEAPTRTITVSLGGAPSQSAILFATTDPWSMRISPRPVGSLGGAPGPATTAAAALVTAEIFRRIVPETAGVRLQDDFAWNLVDYRHQTLRGPRFEPATATCFGVGSVGSSLMLALLASGAAGTMTLVDSDVLQPRNRLRYPLWVGPASGRKVEWIADVYGSGILHVIPRPETAQHFGNRLEGPPTLAISAVDTVEGRAGIADILARETLNAGVDGLRLHVARHRFGDGFACVYCGYVDASPPASEVDTYVAMTGLSPERVTRLIAGEGLSRLDVETMVGFGRLGPTSDDDLVGGRLVDIARARLYASASVPGLGPIGVAAPFVSAMAGSILAAEVLKPTDLRLDRRVDVDMSGWPTGLTSRPRQDPTGRCLCWSAIRKRAYEAAWPTGRMASTGNRL
jgi:hypothetical protein